MIAGVWWFFVLIMVSSYTANLAAFLTTQSPIRFFSNLQDFVENQNKHNFQLGAKYNGSTESFFKDHKDPLYRSVGDYLKYLKITFFCFNFGTIFKKKSAKYGI